jgi:aspartate aminotransferase/aromatic-amino-acid transaminase
MAFLNQLSDGKKMVDKVFKAAVKAREAKEQYGDDVVDATLGTLFDENGTFVALDSVWKPYEKLDQIEKARYARSIQGNPLFIESVYKWLFHDIKLPCEIIATPGGAGAVSATMHNVLNPGQTVIKPSLGWGPYKTMAAEHGLKLTSYNLFKDDAFDIDSFQDTLSSTMEKEGKVLAIINDPCHNPSGYTMAGEEWDQVLSFLNQLAKKGPVIIIHDIAYVDYSTNPSWKDHFAKYQNLDPNVLIVIAFSLSKTFTAYGARVGAMVAISTNEAELQKFKDASIYSARSIWSTCNNSVMELFAHITNDQTLHENYIHEKEIYIQLLRERANIFVNDCIDQGIDIYPYKEGFFVTLKVDDSRKSALNETLQQQHIFTVEVDGGLRVALCSVPKRKLRGLAKRIKQVL